LSSFGQERPLLVIGNRNYSSWSLRPWLALRKSGVVFDTEMVPLDTPEFEQRIAALSPSRRVPALWHQGQCTWDSLAICETVNELWAGLALWPEDPQARALGRSMAAEMHSGFAVLRNEMPMNIRAHGRAVADSDALQADIERVQDLWCQARERFAHEGPWLLGQYSLADAMYAPVVLRFRTYQVPGPEPVRVYCQQVLSDPDLHEWMREAQAETQRVEADEAGEP
jgi:glutathione S-transferase